MARNNEELFDLNDRSVLGAPGYHRPKYYSFKSHCQCVRSTKKYRNPNQDDNGPPLVIYNPDMREDGNGFIGGGSVDLNSGPSVAFDEAAFDEIGRRMGINVDNDQDNGSFLNSTPSIESIRTPSVRSNPLPHSWTTRGTSAYSPWTHMSRGSDYTSRSGLSATRRNLMPEFDQQSRSGTSRGTFLSSRTNLSRSSNNTSRSGLRYGQQSSSNSTSRSSLSNISEQQFDRVDARENDRREAYNLNRRLRAGRINNRPYERPVTRSHK